MFEEDLSYPACRPLPSNLTWEEPEFVIALTLKVLRERRGEVPS